MNQEDMFDGITDIRDDLIDGAKNAPKRQKRWRKGGWLGAVAAVLALAIIGGIFLRPGGGPTAHPAVMPTDHPDVMPTVYPDVTPTVRPVERLTARAAAITRAEYPEMIPYPSNNSYEAYEAWRDSVDAQKRELGDISGLQTFFARSAQTFLTEKPGENRVYSPLNVYMALSMLAQLTDGDSRGQILELLGSESMDGLRRQASDVWNANYRDDGALTSVLASSLWLNRDVSFHRDTMDTLARDFYASSYAGEMGSEEFNKMLQEWLNEQTGGLLEEQAGSVELSPSTVLALATTIYFRAKWQGEFLKESTGPQTFHTPAGDVEADFMHQSGSGGYYWGDKFTAVGKHFETGGAMWFLLPDEGVSPEELLADQEAADFLFTVDKDSLENPWENQKYLIVNKAIPKFDVSSQFDLGDGLRALGVIDVYDPAVSDFTPMTTDVDVPIVVGRANHAARVVIDEEGCTAAAFTVIDDWGTGGPPDEEVDFVLDRPFVFCVTGDSGLPLFVGIVNNPIEA